MRGIPAWDAPHLCLNVGGVLLSHTLSGAVPSALEGLASGFGMGPGVSRSAIATDTPYPPQHSGVEICVHMWCSVLLSTNPSPLLVL